MQIKITFTLEACRKNAGLTLKDAAKKLGIYYQTLSKYENDSSSIPFDLLKRVSNLYQVPTDYIFIGRKYDLIRKIEEKALIKE